MEITGINGLSAEVGTVIVKNCDSNKVIIRSASDMKDSRLELLKFEDIKHLILQPNALDMNLVPREQSNRTFTMSLSNIGLLDVLRGSIRLSGREIQSHFIWKNVVLSSLPAYSITATNLAKFSLETIDIKGLAKTGSLNLESSETSLTLSDVSCYSGMERGWLSGELKSLSILNCRLNLKVGALEHISFPYENSSVIMRENLFGGITSNSQEKLLSFPSHVFDFNFKENSASFNISENIASCDGDNLKWIFTHKSSAVLHWLRCGIIQTLVCLGGEEPPKHEACSIKETSSPTLRSNNSSTDGTSPASENYKNKANLSKSAKNLKDNPATGSENYIIRLHNLEASEDSSKSLLESSAHSAALPHNYRTGDFPYSATGDHRDTPKSQRQIQERAAATEDFIFNTRKRITSNYDSDTGDNYDDFLNRAEVVTLSEPNTTHVQYEEYYDESDESTELDDIRSLGSSFGFEQMLLSVVFSTSVVCSYCVLSSV